MKENPSDKSSRIKSKYFYFHLAVNWKKNTKIIFKNSYSLYLLFLTTSDNWWCLKNWECPLKEITVNFFPTHRAWIILSPPISHRGNVCHYRALTFKTKHTLTSVTLQLIKCKLFKLRFINVYFTRIWVRTYNWFLLACSLNMAKLIES